MGLLKNSRLYNLLNEKAMNVNQAVIQAKNMLDDPIDGFMSTDKAETFLKEKTINKNFKMALTLIDNLAEKMYNKQGEEEFKKHEKQISDIIEYLRFTQKDIYLFNPGPDDSLEKIEQAVIRLAGFVGKSQTDYSHKYDEVHSAASLIGKYKSSVEGFTLAQKQSFSDLINKGMTPGTALRLAKQYSATSEKKSTPTLDNKGKYPGDDGFTYYVQNGQWYAYNIKSKKTTNLSEDPKYTKNVDNLNKHFGTDIKVGDADVNSQEKYVSKGDYAEKLAKLLRSYEGFRSKAYKDVRGIPTIGIGATWYPDTFKKYSGKVQMGQTVTEEEALFIKAEHVKFFQKEINKEIGASNFNALPDNVKASLQSKAFNYGSLGKTLSSTIKQGIKLNNFSGVAKYFKDVLAKHNGGINDWRRKDEAGIIESGLSKRAKISFDMGDVKPIEKGPPLPYVYIADSQGKSGLGKAIIKRMGTATAGKNFFQKGGATAEKIIELYGEKIKIAVSNTQNIILTLGGNGSSKASYLAKDILDNAPESAKITWILAPANNKPNKKVVYDPKFSKGKWGVPFETAIQQPTIDKKKKLRKKYNNDITQGIKAVDKANRINIINPFDWFAQNVKESEDGVHVDDNPGERYIATIQSELKPTSQRAVAMKENFVISETNLQRLLSTLLNENVADQLPKNKEEGDKFRNWVNDNYNQTEIADLYDDLKDKKLDRSGSHNNEYVKRAWRVFGNEYVESHQLKRVSGKEKAVANRGIPNEFFKFKRGKDTDKGQEIYALDVAGNIYKLPKKGGKFIKINETKFYLNELKTKILITESDFDLAKQFLLDLKAMDLDQDPEVAKSAAAAELNIKSIITKQEVESGKVYHPLPSPYYTKLSSVAGAKRGTYRHGGRDYGVPEGTAIYSIKDGVISAISFGGDKFKKYFEFNTNKQAVRDAFPNKKLQEFRRGTFAPIDLTANSLPTKQKNAWLSNDPVKNSTHFFGTGGNWIFIKHEDGIESRYMHLNTIDVKKGEKVKAGQKIGSSGNTGKSTGAHLHFEIRTGEEGSNKNEQKYLEFLENALIPDDRPLT